MANLTVSSAVDTLMQASDASGIRSAVPYPRGYIDGLITSRPTTSTIAIGAGSCRSDGRDANIDLAASITKTEAAWAVGSSAGGLDSGSSYSTSTWYYVYVIKRSDTGVVDAIFSTNKSVPTYPTGYDSARRVGAFYVNSGGTIDKFRQDGDYFTWQPDVKTDLDTTSPATTWTLLTISVPPIEGVLARVFAVVRNTASNATAFVGFHHGLGDEPTQRFTGEVEAYNYYTVSLAQLGTWVPLLVNSTGQIRYQADATSDIRVIVKSAGWIDSRGRT